MIGAFQNAMLTADVQTENGAVAHSTSGSKVLDFFSKSGALRVKGQETSEKKILALFRPAFDEDPELALRALFYARDIRNGGQGERRLFRVVLDWLLEEHPGWLLANLSLIPKYGRWDDLEALTSKSRLIVKFWADAVVAGDNLAAKWAPRKGWLFFQMADAAEMSWKQWRKTLVRNTQVVESQMCAQQWPKINYSHVPSRAGMIYRKAFQRHDKERYSTFITKAVKGEVKINSATLYPSDIVGKVFQMGGRRGVDDATLQAQWNQLPNYMEGNTRSVLPVVDVSGSMSGEPMNVAVSLGLYLSERNVGGFKDLICTFSDRPALVNVGSGSIGTRAHNLANVPWGMNTNLNAVFQLILSKAKAAKVRPEEMPSTILIISDMQFDACASLTGLGMIEQQYRAAGYERPQVVFWNVRASSGQPAKFNKHGVQLVSGYSPGIMKQVLNGASLTAYDLMVQTLDKYSDVEWKEHQDELALTMRVNTYSPTNCE